MVASLMATAIGALGRAFNARDDIATAGARWARPGDQAAAAAVRAMGLKQVSLASVALGLAVGAVIVCTHLDVTPPGQNGIEYGVWGASSSECLFAAELGRAPGNNHPAGRAANRHELLNSLFLVYVTGDYVSSGGQRKFMVAPIGEWFVEGRSAAEESAIPAAWNKLSVITAPEVMVGIVDRDALREFFAERPDFATKAVEWAQATATINKAADGGTSKSASTASSDSATGKHGIQTLIYFQRFSLVLILALN
jgi:hypothetical protein